MPNTARGQGEELSRLRLKGEGLRGGAEEGLGEGGEELRLKEEGLG